MLFPKWAESIFYSRFKIRYIKPLKIDQLITDGNWQIAILKYGVDAKKDYFPLASIIDPLNFKSDSLLKLNKNKKILVYGKPYKNVNYYRFLKSEGYNVYLSKLKLEHFVYVEQYLK